MVSGTSFISKKIEEQRFLRKSHQNSYPLDPGSGKNSSRIKGIKSTESGSATLISTRIFYMENVKFNNT
jgi:hypothetical protein